MKYSQPIQIDEIKSSGGEWEVSGYVSAFNNVDLGNDVILPGAFERSLKSGRKVRFLMAHDPRLVLGVPKSLQEDKKGLFGQFKISKTRLGEETRQLVQDGALDSFSFGYETVDFNIEKDVRYLKQVNLYEASLVAIPMNPDAIVTGFKDFYSLLGIDPKLSLAEKMKAYEEGLKNLYTDLRGLTDKDHPLTDAKRKELMELLETFSGMDAVRSDFQSVLSTAIPLSKVEQRRLKYQMAEKRKLIGQPEHKE